jgi:hypothetical protein
MVADGRVRTGTGRFAIRAFYARPMALDPARELWLRFESVHAVTYFASEARQAMADVGLKGFWMGYFASRAAPLGPVGPGLVTATFFGFHPAMVGRAIPDAWTFAAPDEVLAARSRAAASALRRAAPDIDSRAAEIVPDLCSVVERLEGAGRPLFAANRDLGTADDPVEALWQLVTCLREHRGDGHVAVLTAADIDGCESHVLFAASEGVPDETLRDNRGWSSEEWEAAKGRLQARSALDHDGRLTVEGHDMRASFEATTDRLARAAADLLAERTRPVHDALDAMARAVVASGEIPFPNPMGLPRLT